MLTPPSVVEPGLSASCVERRHDRVACELVDEAVVTADFRAMLGKRMSLDAIAEKLNAEGSNDSRHEPMDSDICSEGVRFLESASAP